MFRYTEQLNPNYKEIGKLLEMLANTDIPHSFRRHFDGWQIGYPCLPPNGDCVCSVVENFFSHGQEDDLLEIMGLLTEEESVCDDVLGYLTAGDVFGRIKAHWEANRNV